MSGRNTLGILGSSYSGPLRLSVGGTLCIETSCRQAVRVSTAHIYYSHQLDAFQAEWCGSSAGISQVALQVPEPYAKKWGFSGIEPQKWGARVVLEWCPCSNTESARRIGCEQIARGRNPGGSRRTSIWCTAGSVRL